MERSGVQRVRTFATYHILHNAGGARQDGNSPGGDNKAAAAAARVVNLHTGRLESVLCTDTADVGNGDLIFVRPRIQILTSSMIVAKQGCGEVRWCSAAAGVG